MRKLFAIYLLLVLSGFCVSTKAYAIYTPQDTIVKDQTKTSTYLETKNKKRGTRVIVPEDSIASLLTHRGDNVPIQVEMQDTIKYTPLFKPNPSKSVLYAAVCPGLGQIYNRKYWKLPIVYGGFLGFAYAISWNGRMYSDYSKAYKDIVTGNGDSWKNFVNITNPTPEDLKRWEPQFKRKKDTFRRNRDLAIILAVGFYALTVLDAYVDAQLYDFDISSDLSLRVEPVIFDPSPVTKRSFGIQCSIAF